ncbi:MAG TPA: MaoC family dehydratase N-terminal domain-containing protein [Actinomycetota bacterium]|nr:MaoC family dehydratase N-terminal domain-containing protein [Actinomycetota bacterium]
MRGPSYPTVVEHAVDWARVGEQAAPYEWVVERGKVSEFARACLSEEEAYLGPDAIAPPTFPTVASNLWEPPGSRVGLDRPFDNRRVLHGGQSYTYERPLRVGETLTGRTHLAEAYEKQGSRGGTMRFAVWETGFTDASGARVATARGTVIETAAAATDGAGRAGVQPDIDPPAPEGPHMVVPGVTKLLFVRYAGASGDFNPIHWDEEYAASAGYPSVFGMGMFTAGVLASFLARWQGAHTIRSFAVRFVGLLWPGENVVCTGSERVADGLAHCELKVTNGRGEPKVTGTATCVRP